MRYTISLDESLLARLQEMIKAKRYRNRSEAIRDLVRAKIEECRLNDREVLQCIAMLSFVFDRRSPGILVDLDQVWGDHQSIVVAAMQALIAGESYMQTVVLRGDAAAVRALENALAGDVRLHHLRLHLVPVQLETLLGNAGFSPHVHASPLT